MLLSRNTLDSLNTHAPHLPVRVIDQLPEKVLQFGTGILLRGLTDYFIDKANRNGLFNGKVVVVKSTPGPTADFERQDNLYTLCIRGIEDGVHKEECIVNTSISRVLSATNEWPAVLACARNPEISIVVSNTTEQGIELVSEAIDANPPVSFPGKLLAFLYERYIAFAGTRESGMIIIPTELIPNNGKKLEAIVLELAHLNGLEAAFIDWIEEANTFCDSLVDRIVPGKPPVQVKQQLETRLGYEDELMVVVEPYALWAIEGDERVRQALGFTKADGRIIIQPDIEIFRELKLRLLNGTHTLSCGLAYLSGHSSVEEAVKSELLGGFIRNVMQNEIGPAIPYTISSGQVQLFCNGLLDRFSNPFIQHHWLAIATQYSSKLKQRIVPLLLEHYRNKADVPEMMSMGVAGFLLFMKPIKKTGDVYYGYRNGEEYVINDVNASLFYDGWGAQSLSGTVEKLLGDVHLWGTDLCRLPGFAIAVEANLEGLLKRGIGETMEEMLQ